MKYIYGFLGIAGLTLLIVAAIMHFTGQIESDRMKDLMLVGTVIWFAGAIPWLGKKRRSSD